ncbi:uncharacterized protein LOC110811157 [Carica papaya]|uniref:uncharacterized protein LOC110811157 n=1 Tax=Carica papaya TaxID=3649 RepID=UPI000B8CE2EE|nr:uncharacterized protein LOC110811157 [Carica papaya]
MSCRFEHHDPKGGGSRRNRSKQEFMEVLPSSKTSNISEEIRQVASEASDHEHDYVKTVDTHLPPDMPTCSFDATRVLNVDQEMENSLGDALQSDYYGKAGQLNESHRIASETSREVVAKFAANTSADELGVGSFRSRQATSPNSGRALRQNFPGSGGDQYDPIFDSIEPLSNFSKKFGDVQKWEAAGGSDMLRPPNVRENKQQKEVGAVAPAASGDNEEFGETADEEVGAVENGSDSDPVDAADMNAGEIDQLKSPVKGKKNKESRLLKHFKVALAEFVKEVLKPSWRQGNMSKEAFKTIVKKTVDKVSGAMKSHQIPKSRAKINQYIDSSQRKLTKLVMGYVDKYVKV